MNRAILHDTQQLFKLLLQVLFPAGMVYVWLQASGRIKKKEDTLEKRSLSLYDHTGTHPSQWAILPHIQLQGLVIFQPLFSNVRLLPQDTLRTEGRTQEGRNLTLQRKRGRGGED